MNPLPKALHQSTEVISRTVLGRDKEKSNKESKEARDSKDKSADSKEETISDLSSGAPVRRFRLQRDPSNHGAPQTVAGHPRALRQAEKIDLMSEIQSIKDEFVDISTELEVMKKAWIECFKPPLAQIPQRLKLQVSPDVLMFTKLLETPFMQLKQEMMTQAKGIEGVVGAKITGAEGTGKTLTLAKPYGLPLFVYFPHFNLNAVSKEHLDTLNSINFNVLSLDGKFETAQHTQHYSWLLVIHMFHNLGLIRYFSIPEKNLYRFLGTICSRYRSVPFHNWYHAFNVTHTMYYFLTTLNCRSILGDVEILALMISCLSHDTDHPGLNNIFQAKANTRVAFFHKRSTLENHHLIQAMSILSLQECNILVNLSQSDQETIRGYIQHIILATDLSLHKLILNSMELHGKKIARQYKAKKPILTRDETVTVLCCLMKCADLSNEIRPKEIALQWATRINEEFFAQSALEKEMGLPLTPWIDPDRIVIEKEQINFITGLCQPLYQAMRIVFPLVEHCLEQMSSNLADWEKKFQIIEEKKNRFSERSVFAEEQTKTKKSLTEFLSSVNTANIGLPTLSSKRNFKSKDP